LSSFAPASSAIIFAAWYLLTAVRGMLQGPLDNPKNENLSDLSRREIWLLVPLIVLFFVIGLFPDLLLDKINPAVDVLIQNITSTTVVGLVP